MASHAAMLLDPKGYKKRLQSNGNDSQSSFTLSASMDETSAPPTKPETSHAPEVAPAASHPETMDLDSLNHSDLPFSGAGRPNSSRSPRPSAPPIAPPGTVPVVRSFHADPATPSSESTTNTSSPVPKEMANSASDPPVQFTSAIDESDESDGKRSFLEISDSDDAVHRRNLIEDVYDVEQRKHQPVKRQKLENPDAKAAMAKKPVAISGDSGLGQFMNDGEVSAVTTPGASAVVDLTADLPNPSTDDDDLQVTGSNDLTTQRVCYGKVENAMVNASLVPKPLANPIFGDEANQWPTMKITVVRETRKGDNRIAVADPHGKVFGVIDAKTAQALCPLLDSPVIPLDITARLDIRKKVPGEVIWGPTSGVYRASLTIYGERRRAAVVGNFLGQHNVWLGTPIFVENGVPLFNPHAEQRRAMAAAAAAAANGNAQGRSGTGVRYESRTVEEVNDAVMKMFDQLISKDIPTMEQPAQVKTPLLHHQKQALRFMTEKEQPRKFGPNEEDNNSLWRLEYQANGSKQYREIITGMVMDHEPPQALGGLLADMMGLGKTLSILALVLSSMEQAKAWTTKPPRRDLIRSHPGIRNTRTTLLVVPLSAVNNWVSQVQEHLQPESLTFNVFHGPTRLTDVEELSRFDLVITTYSTVLSEVSGRGSKRGTPLAKMNMFRIVLDEAHTIREPSAQQTKAILSLHSQRRWSVTGTPIQNRLEDLLSVTKFLKLFPYDDRARFGQYILSPFKSGNPSVLASLRVLVDSFTLRRVKDKINLPPREDKIITLDFSEKEKQLHEFFRNESKVMMNVIAGESRTKMGGRMFHHVLKAMMILRQISAHGKELLDVEDRERIKGLSVQDAIDLEENGPPDSNIATDKKAYEMLMLMQLNGGDQCALCSTRLKAPPTESGETDADATMAYFLPCYDVFCPDCFAKSMQKFDSRSEPESKCPACEGWIPLTFSAITQAGLEEYVAQRQRERQLKKQNKKLGEYEGPHTKTLALIDHLQSIAAESEKLPGEPPIKSVVFSAWTSHLDLIEIALRANGLDSFTRLDGTMSLSARGKALEEFAKNDSITILLATIGAGGVGLNLTSASRVFIMEPQYNPAAVAQAVDRVHRLGQHRPVKTAQFIMKGSIEEKILELAKKKQQLADMSMNRGKLDKREVQEARMREYRSLFK